MRVLTVVSMGSDQTVEERTERFHSVKPLPSAAEDAGVNGCKYGVRSDRGGTDREVSFSKLSVPPRSDLTPYLQPLTPASSAADGNGFTE